MKKDIVRILASQGLESKRKCRKLVLTKKVKIDGEMIKNPKAIFETDGLFFEVDGIEYKFQENIYILMNKPQDVECTHNPSIYRSVFSLIPEYFERRGIQSAGRLDVDTTGLLLLSDDGDFIHHVSSPKRKISKKYWVKTLHEIKEDQIKKLNNGVLLRQDTEPTFPLDLKKIDDRELEIVIGEGKYHQVKRMIAASGNRVAKLSRLALGNLTIPKDLEEGQWKTLSEEDLKILGYEKQK